MKQSILTVMAVTFSLAVASVSYADTISGKIKDIDTNGNSLTLVSQPAEAGEAAEYKLVWDSNMPDFARLQGAHAGEFLSVEAEQNVVTRNWKVLEVKGALARAENAISSSNRTISGQITKLDFSANSLLLATTEADASGKMTEYHVVWDAANSNVRDRIANANIGDKLSLTANQNAITRNWEAVSVVGPIENLIKEDVKTISGHVLSVNAAKNTLILRTTDASGKIVDRKLVWDKNFKDQVKLENAHVGDNLSVRADQNKLTRNWKVMALGA